MDDIDGSPTASTVGEYAYNGLNWRIMRQADTDLDNDLDQQRMMYYSANWQLLEEDVWDDWTAQTPGDIDRHVQYVWGARYIDDIIMRREDRSDGEDPGPDGDYADDDDITRYYLTDAQFSPVAIVDHTAAMIERISYTPYGEARHHRMADLNGDGHTDYQDYLILQNNLDGFGAGDINYDGLVDGDDNQALWADWGAGLAAGRLSYPGEDNIIGYDGYIFNVETYEYTVRFRNYSPPLGRWLERDPIRYTGGMNLYDYVAASPLLSADPLGLLRKKTADNILKWILARQAKALPVHPALPFSDANCRDFMLNRLDASNAIDHLADEAWKCIFRPLEALPGRILQTVGIAVLEELINAVRDGELDEEGLIDLIGKSLSELSPVDVDMLAKAVQEIVKTHVGDAVGETRLVPQEWRGNVRNTGYHVRCVFVITGTTEPRGLWGIFGEKLLTWSSTGTCTFDCQGDCCPCGESGQFTVTFNGKGFPDGTIPPDAWKYSRD